MAKTAMIRARVEPELKQEAEKVFTTLGLSATEAITLFYKHGIAQRAPVRVEDTGRGDARGCSPGSLRQRA